VNVHATAIRVFSALPPSLRHVLLRLGTPSFTVGATAIVRNPEGAVLLVRHAYRPRWGLPGGLLKRGEHPIDAVRRETLEEVGLELEVTGEPVTVLAPGDRRVDLVFPAAPAAGWVRPMSPEIVECRWFTALPPLQEEAAAAFAALAARVERRAPEGPG
jgi:8-oxo-dGTP diphosphatase